MANKKKVGFKKNVEVINNKTVVVNNKKKKRSKNRIRNRKRIMCPYARSVLSPFHATGAHIPDQNTARSGIATSFGAYNDVFTAYAGTSTTHAGGIILFPYPSSSLCLLVETSAGNRTLTDISLTGGSGYKINNVLNLSALYGGSNPGSMLIRCVGIGLRVKSQSTLLNQSASYYAGVLPITYDYANTVGATGTTLSGLSVINPNNGITNTVAELTTAMSQTSTGMAKDGVFEAHWVPNGVPHYQVYDTGTTVSTTSGGASVLNSVFSCGPGGPGCERGQNALVFIFDGDTTGTATANTNSFEYEIKWHWEVIPESRTKVTYELTMSVCDFNLLAECINLFELVPSARTVTSSDENTPPDEVSDGFFAWIESAVSTAANFAGNVANIVDTISNPFSSFVNAIRPATSNLIGWY